MAKSPWWFVTKIECDRDPDTGELKPARIYHRNGGPFGHLSPGKVTKTWTHPIDDKSDCEVCT